LFHFNFGMDPISCPGSNFPYLCEAIHAFILRNESMSNDQWQKFRIKLWDITDKESTVDCAILKTLQMKSFFQHGISYIRYLFTIGLNDIYTVQYAVLVLEHCYLNSFEHFDLELAIQLMNHVLSMYKSFPKFFTEQKAIVLCLCGNFKECSSMWSTISNRSIECRVISIFFIAACRYEKARWIWSLEIEGPFTLSASCHMEVLKYLKVVLQKNGELESLKELDNYVEFYDRSQCLTFDESAVESFKNYFASFKLNKIRLNYIFSSSFPKIKWAVDCGIVTDDGCCSCCGGRLKQLTVSDEDFDSMKEEAFRGVRFQSLAKAFASFRQFLSENAPFDVVVDGFTTSSLGGPASNDVQLKRIEDLIRLLKSELNFKNVLLITRQRLMHSDLLHEMAKLYSVTNIFASDACLIDAALNSGKDCYIVSSEMPNLVWDKFNDQCQLNFLRWKEMRWICSEHAVLNSSHQSTLQMPKPLCPNVEKNGDHGYHFRFVLTGNDDTNNKTKNIITWGIIVSSFFIFKNVHRADMRTYYYTEGWHNQLKEIVGEHQLELFELQHLLITEQDAVCNVTLIDTIRKCCP
ncbi:Mitochondrial ribonuclease P protein 3, partial [Trichinella nativa]